MKVQANYRIQTSLFLAFLFSGLLTYGQDIQKKKTVKFYGSITQTTLPTIGGYDSFFKTQTLQSYKSTQFGNFTPAISFVSENGNFREIELTRLHFNNTDTEILVLTDTSGDGIYTVAGQKVVNHAIAFRYEQNFMVFKKNNESKLKKYIGVSVNPYFSNTQTDPKSSLSFASNRNNIGASLSIIPRINYYLSEKLFIDVNLPLTVTDMSWTFDKVENPSFTARQQKTTTFDYAQFSGNFLLRFGVGFKI